MIVRDVEELSSFDFFNDAQDTITWLRGRGRNTEAEVLEAAFAEYKRLRRKPK